MQILCQAKKRPWPACFMPLIAWSIMTYCKAKSSLEIALFMLVIPDLGKER